MNLMNKMLRAKQKLKILKKGLKAKMSTENYKQKDL